MLGDSSQFHQAEVDQTFTCDAHTLQEVSHITFQFDLLSKL